MPNSRKIVVTVAPGAQPEFLVNLITHLRGVGSAEIAADGDEAPSAAISAAYGDKVRRVVEAAILYAFCPESTGFQNGPTVAIAAAELHAAVEALTGLNPGARRDCVVALDAALRDARSPYGVRRYFSPAEKAAAAAGIAPDAPDNGPSRAQDIIDRATASRYIPTKDRH